MNDGDKLAEIISTIYERNRDLPSISPAWLATTVMEVIQFPRSLHALGYVGCHLQLRQIARKYCRKKFDPTEADLDDDDLFPETLQPRYPLRTKRGEEPSYVRREFLSADDRAYNVERMRRAGFALQKHADALEAEGRRQSPPAAAE